MVSWLQGFCDKSKGQKDERDGLEILSDIMNSQIFNYLKAKRALIHLGTGSYNVIIAPGSIGQPRSSSVSPFFD